MRGSSRDEYCVSLALGDGVTNDTVLLEQARPQVAVEVDRLVVDGVVVWLQLVTLLDRHLVQEVSDLVCVPRVVDVPQGTHHHTLLPHALLGGEVTASLINGTQALLEQVVLVAVRRDTDVDDEVDSIAHIHVEVG